MMQRVLARAEAQKARKAAHEYAQEALDKGAAFTDATTADVHNDLQEAKEAINHLLEEVEAIKIRLDAMDSWKAHLSDAAAAAHPESVTLPSPPPNGSQRPV